MFPLPLSDRVHHLKMICACAISPTQLCLLQSVRLILYKKVRLQQIQCAHTPHSNPTNYASWSWKQSDAIWVALSLYSSVWRNRQHQIYTTAFFFKFTALSSRRGFDTEKKQSLKKLSDSRKNCEQIV
ncbi:hypothetical protein XELAEV_18026288mg [Xenopus laevis]|uniref:Uncharacterized protein n=1 Tax=Xenopus laevis TaxID=8355 RepID=A0A974CTK9_XENLA|nr:hypothetical protein XELAEV_18026288mg [Xenopus laevis]